MPSIEHPNHSLSDEAAASLCRLQEAEVATQIHRDKIDKLARANREERTQIATIRESIAQARGLNTNSLQSLRDISAQKLRRVREGLLREAIRVPLERPTLDFEPAQPEPSDPTFWWAKTEWSHSARTPGEPDEGSAAHFGSDFRPDGLHFRGGVTTHDGDLYHDRFGAVAFFELQPDRIPRSLPRLWRSTPYVELFGSLLGSTGDDDIFTGDLWSKCWMHRDQQLFQWGFGQSGPVPIVLGQAHETETLIFEENEDRSVRIGLRGFQWMPPVTFGNINLANSLWARLEIRFDIQTEGAGSLLWLDPEILIRTFQWPLTAL